jgi:hypothetical protein
MRNSLKLAFFLSAFCLLKFMKITKNITNRLETHASSPSYGAWVLAGVAICYLGAAINTMAGWLYVISGVCLALLGVSVFLARRSLKNLVVKRAPIPPVTVGEELSIEIEIYKSHPKTCNLITSCRYPAFYFR